MKSQFKAGVVQRQIKSFIVVILLLSALLSTKSFPLCFQSLLLVQFADAQSTPLVCNPHITQTITTINAVSPHQHLTLKNCENLGQIQLDGESGGTSSSLLHDVSILLEDCTFDSNGHILVKGNVNNVEITLRRVVMNHFSTVNRSYATVAIGILSSTTLTNFSLQVGASSLNASSVLNEAFTVLVHQGVSCQYCRFLFVEGTLLYSSSGSEAVETANIFWKGGTICQNCSLLISGKHTKLFAVNQKFTANMKLKGKHENFVYVITNGATLVVDKPDEGISAQGNAHNIHTGTDFSTAFLDGTFRIEDNARLIASTPKLKSWGAVNIRLLHSEMQHVQFIFKNAIFLIDIQGPAGGYNLAASNDQKVHFPGGSSYWGDSVSFEYNNCNLTSKVSMPGPSHHGNIRFEEIWVNNFSLIITNGTSLHATHDTLATTGVSTGGRNLHFMQILGMVNSQVKIQNNVMFKSSAISFLMEGMSSALSSRVSPDFILKNCVFLFQNVTFKIEAPSEEDAGGMMHFDWAAGLSGSSAFHILQSFFIFEGQLEQNQQSPSFRLRSDPTEVPANAHRYEWENSEMRFDEVQFLTLHSLVYWPSFFSTDVNFIGTAIFWRRVIFDQGVIFSEGVIDGRRTHSSSRWQYIQIVGCYFSKRKSTTKLSFMDNNVPCPYASSLSFNISLLRLSNFEFRGNTIYSEAVDPGGGKYVNYVDSMNFRQDISSIDLFQLRWNRFVTSARSITTNIHCLHFMKRVSNISSQLNIQGNRFTVVNSIAHGVLILIRFSSILPLENISSFQVNENIGTFHLMEQSPMSAIVLSFMRSIRYSNIFAITKNNFNMHTSRATIFAQFGSTGGGESFQNIGKVLISGNVINMSNGNSVLRDIQPSGLFVVKGSISTLVHLSIADNIITGESLFREAASIEVFTFLQKISNVSLGISMRNNSVKLFGKGTLRCFQFFKLEGIGGDGIEFRENVISLFTDGGSASRSNIFQMSETLLDISPPTGSVIFAENNLSAWDAAIGGTIMPFSPTTLLRSAHLIFLKNKITSAYFLSYMTWPTSTQPAELQLFPSLLSGSSSSLTFQCWNIWNGTAIDKGATIQSWVGKVFTSAEYISLSIACEDEEIRTGTKSIISPTLSDQQEINRVDSATHTLGIQPTSTSMTINGEKTLSLHPVTQTVTMSRILQPPPPQKKTMTNVFLPTITHTLFLQRTITAMIQTDAASNPPNSNDKAGSSVVAMSAVMSPNVARAVVATGSVSTAIAGLLNNPATAGQGIKTALVAGAVHCSFVEDDLVPPLLEMPVQVSMGTSIVHLFTGSLLMTSLLFLLIPMALALAFVFLLRRSGSSSSGLKTFLRYIIGNFTVMSISYFLPVVGKNGIFLFLHGSEAVDIVVATVATVILVPPILISFIFLQSSENFFHVVKVSRKLSGGKAGRSEGVDAKKDKKNVRKLEFESTEEKEYIGIFEVTMLAFDGCRDPTLSIPRIYFLEELLSGLFLGILDGIRPVGGNCLPIAIAMTIVAFFHWVYLVQVHPYFTKLDSFFSMATASCLLVLGSTAIIIVAQGGSTASSSSLEKMFGWMAFSLNLLFFSQILVIGFWRLVRQSKREVEKRTTIGDDNDDANREEREEAYSYSDKAWRVDPSSLAAGLLMAPMTSANDNEENDDAVVILQQGATSNQTQHVNPLLQSV